MEKTRYPGIYRRNGAYVGVVTYRDGFGRKKHKWLSPEPTLTRARDARRNMLNDLERGLRPDGSKMTLEQFVTECYLPDAEMRLRSNTLRNYRTWLVHDVLPVLGKLRLKDITRRHLQQLDAGLSRPTAVQCHAVLSAVFSFAVRDEGVLAVPCATVRRPRYKAPEARHLQPEDARRMLAGAVGNPIEPAIVLGLAGGLRIAEVTAVRWADLEDDGTLTVRRSAWGDTKSGKVRSITLPASAMAAIRRLKRVQAEQLLAVGIRQDADTSIVADPVGRPVTPASLAASFRAFCSVHGFDVTFHGLRHTNAISMLVAGVDVKTAASRLGHASPALLLSTYSHFIRTADKAAADRIEAMFGG